MTEKRIGNGMDMIKYVLSKNVSSLNFFEMLPRINNIVQEGTPFLLDFSYVKWIDGNVIPNMLLLGHWLERKTGYIPTIRLGRDFQSGHLKKYLYYINFFYYADDVYKFEDPDERYKGWEGKNMDKENRTLFFSFPYAEIKNEKELPKRKLILEKRNYEARRAIYDILTDFFVYYFSEFNYGSYDEKMNRILDILSQIVSNSILRGLSEAYLTVQAVYIKRRILVSASDRGIGMKRGIEYTKTSEYLDKKGHYSIDKDELDEKEAIVQSMYYRKDSEIYGLYTAINHLLEMDGTIRIHSNDTKIILEKNVNLFNI